MKYCPNCGNEIDDTKRFCPNCGEKIVSNVEGKETIDVEKDEKHKKGIVTIIGDIVRYIFGGFFCIISLTGLMAGNWQGILGILFGASFFPFIYRQYISKVIKNRDLFIAMQIVLPIILFVIFALSFVNYNENNSSNNNSYDSEPVIEKNRVTVADLSAMTDAERDKWCDDNNVRCSIITDYSNTIEKDGFISQSVEPGKEIYEFDTITIKKSLGREPTIGQKNAVRKAQSYLRAMAFSRSGLIHQLEYEGFSTEDATYAVDNISVDWNEQAVKKAKSYLSVMAFSRSGLIHQLEYEGFTYEQAVYGAEQNGY